MEEINSDFEKIKSNIIKIKENIEKNKIYDDITLVAATKTVSPDRINFALNNGITHIGENRVQELLEKYDSIDKKAVFHFIGHLQKNKVKYIIDKVKYIHSVDNIELAREIDKRAKNHNIVMNVFVEINICNEETKSGILIEDFDEFYKELLCFNNINMCGIMAIPQLNCDIKYFKKLFDLFNKYKKTNNNFKYLSMGMTNDYISALKSGSNMIRIGRGIFGERI